MQLWRCSFVVAVVVFVVSCVQSSGVPRFSSGGVEHFLQSEWAQRSGRLSAVQKRVSASQTQFASWEDFAAHKDATPLSQWSIKFKEGVDVNATASLLGVRLVAPVGSLASVYLVEPLEAASVFSGVADRETRDRLTASSLSTSELLEWSEQQLLRVQEKRAVQDEPFYQFQWHLKNTGQSGGAVGEDSNIEPVWSEGITGAGVQICIVDDSLQHVHPDLTAKFVAADSYDYNGNDPDPSPGVAEDAHGTACAGVAAAGEGDGVCGVGAAYGARLAGVRAISGPLSLAGFASAVSHKLENNQIYSCSWGIPACDVVNGNPICRLVNPLSNTEQQALQDSVTLGRNGKGNIYVFAAGNSADIFSNVNYQDYSVSIYTIAVGAITNRGIVAPYSEPGSALHISAHSSGANQDLRITTTDVLGANGYSSTECSANFGGTSSACPLVAGIIALMLEKNPDLTWRDVQDILALTARKVDPTNVGWKINGANLNVNHNYGFGAIDAAAAVTMSGERDYHLLCTDSYSSPVQTANLAIPDADETGVISTMTISDVENLISIEHTLVTVSMTHSFRGDVQIILISPSGTESILAEPRPDPGQNYQDRQFLSVFNWGEAPNGEWKLRVADVLQDETGTLTSWSLQFYGKCPGEGEQEAMSGGAVAAIVVTVILVVGLVGAFVAFAVWRKRNGQDIVPKRVSSVFKRSKSPPSHTAAPSTGSAPPSNAAQPGYAAPPSGGGYVAQTSTGYSPQPDYAAPPRAQAAAPPPQGYAAPPRAPLPSRGPTANYAQPPQRPYSPPGPTRAAPPPPSRGAPPPRRW